jgi:uncharacterized membrane protein YsdA (DUF1294 family)/cold shock CspA family protein
MRFEGQIKSWNAERGFGFIEPAAGGQDIFLHVSAVPTHHRPPRIGQHFTFEVALDRGGRKRAANLGVAVPLGARRVSRLERSAQWNTVEALAIPAFAAGYLWIAATRGVSVWFALVYVGLSLLSLLAYAIDKSAAVGGRWRSSEQSLLLLGLVGGWPGGLIAQKLLRHKVSKASFQTAFWGTVALNVAAFVIFHVFLQATLHA